MVQILLLSIALICLITSLILTILEAYDYYQDHFKRRVPGEYPAPKSCGDAVELGGLKYGVKWIIKEGVFNNEEKER